MMNLNENETIYLKQIINDYLEDLKQKGLIAKDYTFSLSKLPRKIKKKFKKDKKICIDVFINNFIIDKVYFDIKFDK